MNILGKVILVTLCAASSLSGAGFRYEDQVFVATVDEAISDNDFESKRDLLFYQTEVYGDYFGPKAIEKTIQLYFKMTPKKRDEMPFVEESLVRWGRRTTMTAAAINRSLSGDESEMLEALCVRIESAEKWESLKKSQQFNAISASWYRKDVADLRTIESEKEITIRLKKIVYRKELNEGRFVVDIGDGNEVVFYGRAVTTEQGGVCPLEENFFVSDFAGVTEGGGWEKSTQLNLMSSGTVVSWKKDEIERILQLVKGRNIEGGCDYYLILREGRGRVVIGENLAGLTKEDVSTLAIRAKTIVSNYTRRLVDYDKLADDTRFSRWVAAPKLIEKIGAGNLEISEIMEFLIMNAKNLAVSGDPEFKEYDGVINSYK